MKNKIKFVVLFSIIVIVGIIIVTLIFWKKQMNLTTIDDREQIGQKIENSINNRENTLVFEIENKIMENEITIENNTSEANIDAATLTNNIYNLNSEIGTLYIPKTGLRTRIYSNVSVNKMEEMPCFLYTNGGLNKTGISLFVGHNRMNGKLFSDNDELMEGDEFFFKDYEEKEMRYIIYSKFIVKDSDVSFLNETVTNPVIALSCCTDDNNEDRLILLGKAEY